LQNGPPPPTGHGNGLVEKDELAALLDRLVKKGAPALAM
jgi:hypothetical protein